MLLEIDDLHAGYGAIDVLRGVSLNVGEGELVAVLGPNGAGKTTLLRAISGFEAAVRSGTIRFEGHDVTHARTEQTVAMGLLQVPEGRALFTELSVDDNLRLGGYTRARADVARELVSVYDRFPELAARKSQISFSLSGGEQQMLAIGRALMARPRLLCLDEPTTGLAPRIATGIFTMIAQLSHEGTAVLLVEQNAYLSLQYTSRAYILENGEIALTGKSSDLAQDERVKAIYLGGSTDE